MRLQSIKIENFRCLDELSVAFEPLTSFIGPNNTGKSTVLKAINLLLSKKPVITKDDLHASQNANSFSISGIFGDMNESEKLVFHDHLSPSSTFEFSISTDPDTTGSSLQVIRQHATFTCEEFWFLNPNADGRLSTATKVKSEHTNSRDPILSAFLYEDLKSPRSNSQIQEFQKNWHSENADLELTWKKTWVEMPKSGPILDKLPSVQFLPAELNMEDDASLKSGSLFSRITKMLVAQMETSFKEVQDGIHAAMTSLQSTELTGIRNGIEEAISEELRSWGTKAKININPPDAQSILEKAFELHFDDGISSGATSKGHGLQRASFFALTRALDKLQSHAGEGAISTKSLMLLVEEPELYLHPHAQRQLRQSLNHLASGSDTQVILATHSPQFVNFARASEIRRLSRIGNSRFVHSINSGELNHDLAPKQQHNMDYWLNPHRNEIFFAELVLLVEGQTESVLIPSVCEYLGIDTTNLTVLDANGKNNLIQFINILNSFRIPYVVIHDEDPVNEKLRHTNPEAYKNGLRTFHLNKDIAASVSSDIGKCVLISPDFEKMFGVTPKEVSSYGKGLAAQRRLKQYLEAASPELPQQIYDVVASITSLSKERHSI